MGIKVPVPDERMQETIDKIGLTPKDMETLYKKFLACDDDKSGSIDLAEFYDSFHEKESAFGNAIFSLIDCDNSGMLDFSEYVAALSTFCLFSRDEVLKFCFFVFDDDKSGTIEGEELTALLELLHEEGQSSNLKLAMERFNFNADGKIDFDEFKSLNQQFPQLLYPAFRMQENMKIHTMGAKWWQKKFESQSDAANNAEKAKELQRKKKAKEKRRAQLKGARETMGCFQYYFCCWRRKRYMLGFGDSDDEDNDIGPDEGGGEPIPLTELEKAEKLKLQKEAEAAEKRALKAARKAKKETLSKIGRRRPLSKEERMDRARKRRLRDMADRPGRH